MAWRIGVDIGGTFTDVAMVEEETGRIGIAKVPTTPLDFAEGVLRGSLRVRNLQSFNPHGETVVRDADNRRIRFVVAQAVVHYLEGR